MKTLEEQLVQAQNKLESIQHRIKEKDRKERKAKEKIDQRRNFIIGELVCKYFPQLLKLIPGTKQENTEIFRNLDLFLKVLSEDKNLFEQIYGKVNILKGTFAIVRRNNLSNNEK
ncbi:MAG TPA: hypothetical protein DDX91_07050 [Ruminococcaceae bacterium]|nr:hypothetical protein [Oscillospiraceae bacterium]